VIQIEDVKRLRLAPGDVLVLKLAKDLRHKDVEHLQAEMRRTFPDHTVVVLAPDTDLVVVPAKPQYDLGETGAP
jgi:hypothetical protein